MLHFQDKKTYCKILLSLTLRYIIRSVCFKVLYTYLGLHTGYVYIKVLEH